MITIKEFSKLCKCNTQTLRYYDSIDLLKPFYVDQTNGYRYYLKEQSIDFIKIKNLQEADFTIEKIKCLLEKNDDEIYQAFEEKIKQQQNKLNKIIELQKLYLDEKASMEKLLQQIPNFILGQVDEKTHQIMSNKLRMTFNEIEVNYDKYRPGYPNSLFEDITSYSKINEESNVLEIGVGTGQATNHFLNLKCNVIGVELGDKLYNYTLEKYKDYQNLKMINDDFMNCQLKGNSLDLVYSGTTFHWLPQKEAYAKVMEILKPGGTVALFWNHPFPNREDDPTNVASKKVYDMYRPTEHKITEFNEEQCNIRVQALIEAGFVDVTYKIYKRVRTLTTDEYINLINTYSDHRALDINIKKLFEQEMKKVIDDIGGKINIYDTLDLYLARKP